MFEYIYGSDLTFGRIAPDINSQDIDLGEGLLTKQDYEDLNAIQDIVEGKVKLDLDDYANVVKEYFDLLGMKSVEVEDDENENIAGDSQVGNCLGATSKRKMGDGKVTDSVGIKARNDGGINKKLFGDPQAENNQDPMAETNQDPQAETNQDPQAENNQNVENDNDNNSDKGISFYFYNKKPLGAEEDQQPDTN